MAASSWRSGAIAVSIRECGEPLLPLPDTVVCADPHPYRQLGAPYEDSPYRVRAGVRDRLATAATELAHRNSDWRLYVYDAYRPIAVQRFMVEYTARELARERGWIWDDLAADSREAREIRAQVLQFWAQPSADPATPPAHSTGAALDVTLVDANGDLANMGSPIDECSPRSYPAHFADRDPEIHARRQLLTETMTAGGFVRHPREWWHFSWGDRLWAYLSGAAHARYGRV